MKPCLQCGASNGDDDVFCKGCGASMPKIEQPVVRKVSEPPPPGGEVPDQPDEAAKEPPPPITLPRRTRDKTIVGMPSPVAAPAPAGPPKVRRPGVKAKFHGTLHGMLTDVKDMPVHGGEELEEEPEDIVIDEVPQSIQPIPIMTIGSRKAAEEDKAAGSVDEGDGVDIEILAAATISGDEGAEFKEEVPEEIRPVARGEAPPPAEEKEKAAAAGPSAPPPAPVPPAAAEPRSRSSTVVVVVVTLILILAGGYYYYSQHGTRRQGTGAPAEHPAAGTEAQPRPAEARTWSVKLEGAPGDAVVYVDEVLHPERPVILTESAAPRVFRIEAPGFEPWKKAVAVVADVVLPVAMTQAAVTPGTKEGTTVEVPGTAEGTGPAAAPEKKKKKKKKKKSVYDVQGNPYDD